MDQVVATSPLELNAGFIPAPEQPDDWPAWRERLSSWAREERERLGPVRYDAEAQAWASRAYAQAFAMVWDNELIDHATGEWKVDAYLDRGVREFAGYDLVTLWINYPLSGVDDRHHLSYFDDLPGGRRALAEAVARFHARGVRVAVPHQPWIQTPVPGFASVEDALVELVRECDIDGIFLDCSDGPSDEFRSALAATGRHRAFQSEAPAPLHRFGCEVGSWQQMTDDSAAPGTYRTRWLDRNHLVAESRRYFYDPIREIQRGWMNGGAFVIWENVFGYWAEYSPRCRSWLRLMFPAQRRLAEFFIRGEWTPYVGGGTAAGVFVSKFEWAGLVLYTAVNRRGHTLEKAPFRLPEVSGAARYVDPISGQTYRPVPDGDGAVKLFGRFERDGIAGVLALPTDVDADWDAFLAEQRAKFAEADWSAEPWPGEHRKTALPHVWIPGPETAARAEVPSGMVRLPDFSGTMTTRYRMRECGYIAGVPDERHVYDAFEQVCTYRREAAIAGLAIDAFPVTNADFARFLAETGYRPKEPRNFLKHWTGGAPPAGLENHPVVYVSRADARAYAEWAGKRLPTEEEWQHAVQCGTSRVYPWGDEPPAPEAANQGPSGTTPVDAHPAGRTPEGVWDLCGNVWEMTESERTDGHTRYQILKGGCWYVVQNSHWLFDTGLQPGDWGAKHILLTDGWDRCSTIGFRCAVTVRG
ncbi:MAG: SUMF1/EgtB/PvdO family nonheme iron enzyme [Fimbriimonadaceae bacterium]